MPSFWKRVANVVMPRTRPFSEMGTGGTPTWGGYVASREKSAQWTGQQRWITAADMAVNTPIVASGIWHVTNLLAHPTWSFNPPDDTPEARELADFAQEVLFEGMDTPWPTVVRRSAMYLYYGFGIQEWTAKRRDDGRVGMRDVESRPSHTIERWSIADDGSVGGVVQRSPQTGAELGLPRSKIMYLVEDTLTDSPEGTGILRMLAEPWERLKKYHFLETIAFERDLRGIPVGRIPYEAINRKVSNSEMTKQEAAELVSSMENFVKAVAKQNDTSITMDSQPYLSEAADGVKVSPTPLWDLQLIQGSSNGVEALGKAIHRTQLEMSRLLMAEHLMMGESAGNRALAEDKSRNLYLVSNAVLGSIAAAVDRDLITPLWTLNNFPDELKPRAAPEEVSFKDAETVARVLKEMATAGATVSPTDPVVGDVRELLGVSPPEEVSPELRGLTPGAAVENDDQAGEDVDAEDEDEEVGKFAGPFDKFDPNQPRGSDGKWSGSGVTHVSQLTKAERGSLSAYTFKADRPINRQLRTNTCCKRNTAGHVKRLDSAFDKAAYPKTVTTYRGIDEKLFDGIASRATPGKTVLRDPAYMSTSLERSVAHGFAKQGKGRGGIIKVKVPAGARALNVTTISEFKGEREVLLGRGSKYRVTKIDTRKRVIEVEMVMS